MKLLILLPLLFSTPIFAMSKPPVQSGPILKDDFETKKIETLSIDKLAGSHSASLSTEQARNGAQSLRVELRAQDNKKAELQDTYKVSVGYKTWYHISIFIPDNTRAPQGGSCQLAQWKGGIFASNPALPAPLSIGLNGDNKLTINTGFFPDVKKPDSFSMYEIYSEAVGVQNKWNDFLLEVYWSPRADGSLNVWRNGELVAYYRGPIGFDARLKEDQGPSMILGLNCNKSPEDKMVVFYDMLRRASKYSDINIK